MLATIRHDTKCAQHEAHNPKFEKMGLLTFPVVAIKDQVNFFIGDSNSTPVYKAFTNT